MKCHAHHEGQSTSIHWVLGALVCATMASAASADPMGAGSGTLYRLGHDTTFQEGCFPPCLCPITDPQPPIGTFKLIYLGLDPAANLHTYAVQEVNAESPYANAPRRIVGSGKYTVGSPGMLTVMQHRMELDLRIGDSAVRHFDSGWTPWNPGPLDIRVSINGEFCWDQVIRIHAEPVPASEMRRYMLNTGSTFQRGCIDGFCDCAVGPQVPMIGEFTLVPLMADPLFQVFGVVDVRWRALSTNVADGIPLFGSGVYRIGGEVALQNRLTMTLATGDEEPQTYDSGMVIVGAPFPRIDILTRTHTQCLDTLLHVVASPQNADHLCGGIAGIPCPEGQFCNLPPGHCCCDFQGVCAPIAQACPEYYDPVCGCDGVTYSNPCFAAAAAVSIDHFGPCEALCRPAEDGQGCTNALCSNVPSTQCIATALQLDIHSGAITTLACDCQDPAHCHIEFGNASPFAVGTCPNGGACQVHAGDTDGDGIPDTFRAGCEPIGACCTDLGGSPLPVPVCAEVPVGSCPNSVGIFLGPGSHCGPIEACCLPATNVNGYCREVSRACCLAMGGVPGGPNSSCNDPTEPNACARPCGGPNGLPCPPDEFCRYPEGACPDGVSHAGVCTPIPGACPDVWDPVCGCDGMTYSNECDAFASGVSVAHRGACEPEPCTATRHFVDPSVNSCSGTPQVVLIQLNPPNGASALALEDTPPQSWAVSNISDGGFFDAANGKVKWGPFFPPFPATVSYRVVPASNVPSSTCFAGTVSVDGINEEICGDTCQQPCCPVMVADTPHDGCPSCPVADCNSCDASVCEDHHIHLCEVIGYACAWLNGCHDDLSGMTRAAYVWRNGECYCWRGEDHNWYPADCTAEPGGCCSAGSAVSAADDLGGGVISTQRVPNRSPGQPIVRRVQVDLDVSPSASAMALMVSVPQGWDVADITDGGQWDADARKVKWGPFFDDLSRTVGFQAIEATKGVPDRGHAARPSRWSGVVSVDGVNSRLRTK